MERIRELRTAAKMQQVDLARLLNVEKITISRYERGERQPDPEKICALCDVFGCTADYLLGRSDSQFPTITAKQAELLAVYDVLPDEIRNAVDGLMAPYRDAENKKDAAAAS